MMDAVWASSIERATTRKRAEKKEDRKRRTEVDEQEDQAARARKTSSICCPGTPTSTASSSSCRNMPPARLAGTLDEPGNEFRDLSLRYRDLTPTEKRAISNRLQRRRLGNLLRAMHANDYSAYIAGWEMEAKAAGEEVAGPRPDSP